MSLSESQSFMLQREKQNEILMKYSGLEIKRFLSLDSQVYRDGALSKKQKELLGLVASVVMRCDDCIKYHIIQCDEAGVSSEELQEALSVALTVGGSITIPHLRRAFQLWDELIENS